ncbi:MAG TPA: hypothetical protein VNV35_04825 [Puia sp.]|jgi:hypothetical protein|nr:hypothetical protein [Puia sp.]
MCLLSVGLETLGLLLRVWLWISVPIAVILLLVATWLNYLRSSRSKGNMRLSVEGLGGKVRPGNDGLEGVESVDYSDREDSNREDREDSKQEDSPQEESDREELTATGKETIYQGILWMKEKYEQYREQADRRYELLREEFGRSERRYQELMAIMEQDKNRVLGDHLAEAQGHLDAKQGVIEEKQRIIEDLEAQLRSERLKVEELIKKLQANSELILRIYKELESIPDLGK